jgi:hypothetical protein
VTEAEKANVDLETAIAAILRSLPPLPLRIRYHDDLADEVHAIRNLSEVSSIVVEFDGTRRRTNFGGYGSASPIIKHVIADWFTRVWRLETTEGPMAGRPATTEKLSTLLKARESYSWKKTGKGSGVRLRKRRKVAAAPASRHLQPRRRAGAGILSRAARRKL